MPDPTYIHWTSIVSPPQTRVTNLNIPFTLSAPKIYYDLIQAHTGTKYYVDAYGGNDSGNGSETQPWLTPPKAFDTAETGSMIIIRPGTYIYTRTGELEGGDFEGVNYSNAVVWDTLSGGTVKELKIVCYPNLVILRASAPDTADPRDFHSGSLRHPNSYIYGAIIERDNGGRTDTYSNAFFAHNGGYEDVKGSYYNCVFKEINAVQRYSITYGNTNGGCQFVAKNCLFIADTWQNNYDSNSQHGTLYNCASNDSNFNTSSDASIENNVVKNITYNADYSINNITDV